MQQVRLLTLTRLASFLALLFIFLNYHMVVLLSGFFPALARGVIAQLALFSYPGVVLGVLICPIFLPTPAGSSGVQSMPCIQKKPLPQSMVFIVLMVLPNIILRSLGVEIFIASYPVRAIIMFLTGLLSPLCYGLFFLTHLKGHDSGKNRLDRYCTFLFGIAIVAAHLIHSIKLSLLELSGLAPDPLKIMSLSYNIITGLILGIGGSAIVSVILLNKLSIEKMPAGDTSSPEKQSKTKWALVLRLIGLATVFRILNAIMDLRLTPGLNFTRAGVFYPYLFVVGLAIPIIALLFGPNIDRFIKWFLPPAIALFILIPCLYFFENYPNFIMFMNILVGLFQNLVWLFFSAALVEAYAPNRSAAAEFRGFFFYGIATAIYFTNVFAFAIFRFNRYMPPISTEFAVLLAAIAAIVFFFLSFRILLLFHVEQKQSIGSLETVSSPSLEEIFKEHGLTEREMEVAALILREGLDNEEIARRIFRATITVKTHLTNIYQKFGVKGRTEFMALFIKK